ncbi:MAG: tRNA (adenine-N1)-methyltransferase [Methanobacteriota archaeon]
MQRLVLLDSEGRKRLVTLEEPMVRVPGFGTFETGRLRAHVGRRIEVGRKAFVVLDPSPRDLYETMERGPQALTPKDLAAILYGVGVRAGARVGEAGCGSGALTLCLARAVHPKGKVIAYDMRADALEIARSNLARSGLEGVVEFRQGDVRERILERELDAVVLDMPDPWEAIQAAWEALRPCGHLSSFSPNMEQVKETATAIRTRAFVDLRTIEIIEREMEVRDVGVRPSFAPLGHTGYLTFARKVLEAF